MAKGVDRDDDEGSRGNEGDTEYAAPRAMSCIPETQTRDSPPTVSGDRPAATSQPGRFITKESHEQQHGTAKKSGRLPHEMEAGEYQERNARNAKKNGGAQGGENQSGPPRS